MGCLSLNDSAGSIIPPFRLRVPTVFALRFLARQRVIYYTTIAVRYCLLT